MRDFLLAPVLFHEIGHHIHANFRPEFREREDVADSWQAKLERSYYRKHPFFKVITPLATPFRGLIRKTLTSAKVSTTGKTR